MFLVNKIKNIVIVVLVLALLASSGWIYRVANNPTIETVVEYVEKEIPIEIPVEVTKPVYIEKIVEVMIDPPAPPEPAFLVSSVDRELIARTVYLEAGGESFECMTHVASVIFARLMNGYWGDTFTDVIYSPSQFAVAPVISVTFPSETAYEAVDYVIEHGLTLPPYVLYFRADYDFQWDGYVGYYNIDNIYFGYQQADKNACEFEEG